MLHKELFVSCKAASFFIYFFVGMIRGHLTLVLKLSFNEEAVQ